MREDSDGTEARLAAAEHPRGNEAKGGLAVEAMAIGGCRPRNCGLQPETRAVIKPEDP